jgi:hypothetical protein
MSENRNVRLSAQEPKNGPATTSASSCPLIPVGSVVNVQGKVRVKHNSRELYGDSIGLYSTVTPSERILLNHSIVRCRGLGKELEHWRRVTALHKNYYFLPERFVIPSSSGTNVIGARDIPHTPKSTRVIASTPSTHSTASSSTTSSPAKSSDDTSVRLRPSNCCAPPKFLTFILFHASFYSDFVIPPVSTAGISRKIHSEYM